MGAFAGAARRGGGMLGRALLGGLAAVSGALLLFGEQQLVLSPSFGALATLLYGAPRSALAQPANALLGHVLGALIGVVCRALLGPSDVAPLAPALAVALTVALGRFARILHPPAGAVALYATLPASADADSLRYALLPVLLGDAVLVSIALLLNNWLVDKEFHYPVVESKIAAEEDRVQRQSKPNQNQKQAKSKSTQKTKEKRRRRRRRIRRQDSKEIDVYD